MHPGSPGGEEFIRNQQAVPESLAPDQVRQFPAASHFDYEAGRWTKMYAIIDTHRLCSLLML
jgi:hypothetical protein